MHCANFPRHLGRLITRCLIAHPEGADTIELAHWAYGEVLPRYARHNVRRHCLSFGIPLLCGRHPMAKNRWFGIWDLAILSLLDIRHSA